MYESKEGILFLWLNKNEFYAQKANKRGVSVEQTYKNMDFLEKTSRNLQLLLNQPSISKWFGEWKNKLNKYHTVIVHASILTPPVVEYIRKNNEAIRIIVWYWNPVEKTVNVNKFKKYDCEIWTFDERDAKKYSLNYNTQYYFKDIPLYQNNIKQDVFFIGGDKGRIGDIVEIENKFTSLNISTKFHVTPSKRVRKKYRNYYKERISYEDVLKNISESKSVLDIISEGQTGLTLRPLESLFLEKKLITNDTSIINRDFYNKSNIFLLGKEPIENVSDFLDEPYEESDPDLIIQYDFNSWLDRFYLKK